MDFGTHHCPNSSGRVQASNTMRAGASNTRVTTISRSERRSAVVACCALPVSRSFPSAISLLLAFQFLDDPVQLGEAGVPDLAIALDPRRRLVQRAVADPAGAHAPDLLGGD